MAASILSKRVLQPPISPEEPDTAPEPKKTEIRVTRSGAFSLDRMSRRFEVAMADRPCPRPFHRRGGNGKSPPGVASLVWGMAEDGGSFGEGIGGIEGVVLNYGKARSRRKEKEKHSQKSPISAFPCFPLYSVIQTRHGFHVPCPA